MKVVEVPLTPEKKKEQSHVHTYILLKDLTFIIMCFLLVAK